MVRGILQNFANSRISPVAPLIELGVIVGASTGPDTDPTTRTAAARQERTEDPYLARVFYP